MTSINNFRSLKAQPLIINKAKLEKEKGVEEDKDKKEETPQQNEGNKLQVGTLRLQVADGSKFLADYIKSTVGTQSSIGTNKTSGPDNAQGSSSGKKTGAAAGAFDFSVVPGYNDDFSSFYTQLRFGALGGATSKKTLDEGYWDNALDALDKLRPQLHEYIKAQLEAKGLEYNEGTVDKFIDYFISQSVEMAIYQGGFPLEQTAENWEECGKSSNGRSFKMSTVVEALLSMIDGELGKDSEHYAFGAKMGPHSAPDAFSETSWNKTGDLNHHKVQDTADKFLNSDEKMLKTVLVGLEMPDSNPFGQTTTSTKYTVQHILELYQDTVRGYLKQTYTDLNDEQINNILSKAMTETMKDVDSMRITSGMNKGKYNLEQALQSYGAKCEEILKSDYPEAATNHHEGYLYGETNDRYSEICRNLSVERITTKFDKISNKTINAILDTLADYGNKLNINDLDIILNKLSENCKQPLDSFNGIINTTTNESMLQEIIKSIVDKYLDNKEHRSGLLFGIGGGMASAQVWAMSSTQISDKFPDLSQDDINEILTMIAEYGNKLSPNDLDGILNKIAEFAPDGKLHTKLDIETIIDMYLREKPEDVPEDDTTDKPANNPNNITQEEIDAISKDINDALKKSQNIFG